LRDGLDSVAVSHRARPRPDAPALLVGEERRPVGLDVVFTVLHGTYGEDGTVQGASSSRTATPARVAASGAAMDKG
jgi:D-alanine-D-alanine ligase-like ATP-grasp enzyme